MNIELLEKIKKLTLFALVADEVLLGQLVLKGGNALNLAYDMSSRGSMDIDFSLSRDFTHEERNHLKEKLEILLNEEFNKEEMQVIDVTFADQPGKIAEEVKDFWGGYLLEFKVVPLQFYKDHSNDLRKLRMAAYPIYENNSPKFSVEFSKYEFIGDKQPQDIDGNTVYVYSPEMLAIEKLRALCQQDERYKEIIISKTPCARARDFYDIYKIKTQFNINFKLEKNIELIKDVFKAKKVPIDFVCNLKNSYDFHFQDWDSVLNTITEENVLEFKSYFDFVISEFKFLCE